MMIRHYHPPTATAEVRQRLLEETYRLCTCGIQKADADKRFYRLDPHLPSGVDHR